MSSNFSYSLSQTAKVVSLLEERSKFVQKRHGLVENVRWTSGWCQRQHAKRQQILISEGPCLRLILKIAPVNLMLGIQYCRVHSPVELIALVKILPGILATDHKVFSMEILDRCRFLLSFPNN